MLVTRQECDFLQSEYLNHPNIESSGAYRWPPVENERIHKGTEYEYIVNLVPHMLLFYFSERTDEIHSHTPVGSKWNLPLVSHSLSMGLHCLRASMS